MSDPTKVPGSVKTRNPSAGRSFSELGERDRGGLSLSSHDINIISIVAQNPSMSRGELLDVLKTFHASSDAIDIVTIILDGAKSRVHGMKKSNRKMLVAKNYSDWGKGLVDRGKCLEKDKEKEIGCKK